jgi:hypothetical protein
MAILLHPMLTTRCNNCETRAQWCRQSDSRTHQRESPAAASLSSCAPHSWPAGSIRDLAHMNVHAVAVVEWHVVLEVVVPAITDNLVQTGARSAG